MLLLLLLLLLLPSGASWVLCWRAAALLAAVGCCLPAVLEGWRSELEVRVQETNEERERERERESARERESKREQASECEKE